MPKGTYLLQELDLPIEFEDLLFVEKVRFNPVEPLSQALEAKVGPVEDLQVHPIVGSPFGDLRSYMAYSTPQRIKAALRAGRTILLQQGADVLCVFPNEVKTDADMLECKFFPLAPNHAPFVAISHATHGCEPRRVLFCETSRQTSHSNQRLLTGKQTTAGLNSNTEDSVRPSHWVETLSMPFERNQEVTRRVRM